MKLSDLTKENKDTTKKREFLKKCIDCASDDAIEEIGPLAAAGLGVLAVPAAAGAATGYIAKDLIGDSDTSNIEEIGPWLAGALGYGAAKIMDDNSVEEVAPPGANYERMVKHLKDKFGDDSPVPYQIAWTKYKNRGKK